MGWVHASDNGRAFESFPGKRNVGTCTEEKRNQKPCIVPQDLFSWDWPWETVSGNFKTPRSSANNSSLSILNGWNKNHRFVGGNRRAPMGAGDWGPENRFLNFFIVWFYWISHCHNSTLYNDFTRFLLMSHDGHILWCLNVELCQPMLHPALCYTFCFCPSGRKKTWTREVKVIWST